MITHKIPPEPFERKAEILCVVLAVVLAVSIAGFYLSKLFDTI